MNIGVVCKLKFPNNSIDKSHIILLLYIGTFPIYSNSKDA